MKRKWFAIAIAACLTLSLIAIPLAGGCAAPAPAKTYNWIMSSYMPEGYILYDLSVDFIERVQTESDGRISIEHYPGDLLGDYETQMKSTTAGTQDLAISSPSTVNSPKWDLNVTFYITPDWDAAKRDYAQPDGWLWKAYGGISHECNWQLLGLPLQGFTGIISNVKFDPMPGPKDVKIRVMASETARLILEGIGFSPVTIPWSEIPSAMMLGTVDAAWGPTSADDFAMLSDVYEYAYRFNTNAGTNMNVINLELFNSLDSADQEMLLRIGKEWQEYCFSVYVDHDNAAWDELKKTKTVIELTREEWEANAKIAGPIQYPYLEGVIGKELTDQARAHAPK